MITFRQYIHRRRILKKVQPLNFLYDRAVIKNDTQYLINWLGNIGIEATDISKNNKYSSVLAVNIMGKDNTYSMYCINVSLYRGAGVSEEQLIEMHAEATKYGATPVIILAEDIGNNLGLLAKMLGIQVVITSQIDGFNMLLMDGKMPETRIENTMFISKLAYYTHMKLA